MRTVQLCTARKKCLNPSSCHTTKRLFINGKLPHAGGSYSVLVCSAGKWRYYVWRSWVACGVWEPLKSPLTRTREPLKRRRSSVPEAQKTQLCVTLVVQTTNCPK